MPDVNEAGSSPAQDSSEILASMTSEQRSDWRATGKIPEPSTKQESAPADTSKETTSVADDTATPDAETGKQTTQEHKERKGAPGAEARIRELVAKVKEYERKEAERSKAAETVTAPAPKQETKPSEPKRLSEAEYFEQNPTKEYADYLEYLTDFKVEQKLKAKSAEDAKSEAERKQQEKAQELEKGWKAKVDAAIEAHDDFKDVVTKEFNDKILPGTVLDGWLIDSDHGAEIMYHYAKNPDELTALLEKPPFAQTRILTKLEDKLASPEKKETAPAPQVTKAPKPASEVGGRGTAPEDAAAAAAKDGNYRAYKAEQDRRDLERAKRG
jgi:hypothetical protein